MTSNLFCTDGDTDEGGDDDEGGASIQEYLPKIEYVASNPGYGIYTAYYNSNSNNSVAY